MGTSDAGAAPLHDFTLAVFEEKMCVRSQPRSRSAPCLAPLSEWFRAYKSLVPPTSPTLDLLEALAIACVSNSQSASDPTNLFR